MKYLRLGIIIIILDSLLSVWNCYSYGSYIYYNAAIFWCMALAVSIVAGIICLWSIKNWKMALIWFANILISGLILLMGCEIVINSYPPGYDEDIRAVEIINEEL